MTRASRVPVDITTQVTNDVTIARYALRYSSSLPCHKRHQSDHASSAVRPCPGSFPQPMTAGRLKHMIGNVRDNRRSMLADARCSIDLLRIVVPTHSSMVSLPLGVCLRPKTTRTSSWTFKVRQNSRLLSNVPLHDTPSRTCRYSVTAQGSI